MALLVIRTIVKIISSVLTDALPEPVAQMDCSSMLPMRCAGGAIRSLVSSAHAQQYTHYWPHRKHAATSIVVGKVEQQFIRVRMAWFSIQNANNALSFVGAVATVTMPFKKDVQPVMVRIRYFYEMLLIAQHIMCVSMARLCGKSVVMAYILIQSFVYAIHRIKPIAKLNQG